MIGVQAQAQEQEPQLLIPIRGVPFGPAVPIVPVQPIGAPPSQHQGSAGNTSIQQPAIAQPVQERSQQMDKNQIPVTPGATQQSVSLLPTEVAARQAAAVAASVVPPEQAARDISTLAGEYSYGNGFDSNCTLEISPDGRFLYKQCDCEEIVDQSEGVVSLSKSGDVVLNPVKPRTTWPKGTSQVLVPVSWGQRLYLVPDNDMIGFLNQVNRGMEPVTRGSMGSYYLREGDWDRPAEGKPDLPESWIGHLLAQPVQGMVAGRDPSGRWIINLGQMHGVFNGMELTALRADGRRFVTLRVTDTGIDTSAVEVLEAEKPAAVQGWNVYSRVVQAEQPDDVELQ